MVNTNAVLDLYENSFRANIYTVTYFRMIGLIDVNIDYYYGLEKVTLAFYSSSGTNNGKIKGLWYPIVGIKLYSGPFTEFSPYINYVLSHTTQNSTARRGWLAKSPFFYGHSSHDLQVHGFSNGKHNETLFKLGENLRELYNNGMFINDDRLDASFINHSLTAPVIYPGNTHSQEENFHHFIYDIYHQY